MLLGRFILICLPAKPLLAVVESLPIFVTLVKSSNSGNTSGERPLKYESIPMVLRSPCTAHRPRYCVIENLGIDRSSSIDRLVAENVLNGGQRHSTQQTDSRTRHTSAVHRQLLAHMQFLHRSLEQNVTASIVRQVKQRSLVLDHAHTFSTEGHRQRNVNLGTCLLRLQDKPLLLAM